LINVEGYKHALVEMNLSEKQIAMLVAHYRAPDRRITMTILAEAVGYKSYQAANLKYGHLGKSICNLLGENPDDYYDDGKPFWLSALAEAWKNKSGEYEFQMWPELAEALKELNLV